MTNLNKMSIALAAMLFFSLTAVAQTTYFAGTNSGTGNTGSYVTGAGANVLALSNSGSYNAGFGTLALYRNTTGTNNTGIGSHALTFNTTGRYNTSTGYASLGANTSGSNNTGLGTWSLFTNTTGAYNTATGTGSCYSNTTGNNNTAHGYYALFSNTTGYDNTAVGNVAMKGNLTGYRSVSLGDSSLYTLTNGYQNTAIGAQALKSTTWSIDNTAIGYKSLYKNDGGISNTAVGSYALGAGTTGFSNTAVGVSAMINATGSNNAAFGLSALVVTAGGQNTVMGNQTLYDHVTGDYNVAVGFGAGTQDPPSTVITSLSNSTLIGASARPTINSLINVIAIGYGATVNASNKAVIGNTAVTSIGGQVGWTTYSDRRLKTNINKSTLGLDFILALNPVTYNYKAEGQKGITYTGLIAQEVDEAAKKAGVEFSGVDKNGEYWGIRYGELTVPLIKAVQEMSNRINELEKKLADANKVTAAAEPKLSSSVLYQNNPNPFNQSTTISYKLSSADENAAIIIRNMNGSIMRQLKLSSGERGSVTINANELASGTYTYSLLANGNVVDTKLMVITK